ncbi:MAG TPA: formyltetrahydrofolate deformylase [Trebonia sp.]|jgi:formyltetrahydrofolate deformylase|nr:formyltetrahydrofolate deformylase [Trebonia sp.]
MSAGKQKISEDEQRGQEYVLTLSCPDKPGIVYSVSSFLVQHSANIVASQQYGQPDDGRFFMRVHFSVPPPGRAIAGLERDFSWVAESFHMSWRLHNKSERVRTLIMVSRLGHCLNDLLFRWRSGSLPVEIAGVVSNHGDFRELTESYRLPFHHIPVTPETKPAAETALLSLVDETRTELIVLARYMQILSPEVCKRVEGRMINIHHSFLPSFKGARPYHQAYAKGVKIVGATAHYVTPDLDEGPIIEQDVMRVDHTFEPQRLAEAGRDVEAQVLARAVTWHAEHRVLLNGNRTVILH